MRDRGTDGAAMTGNAITKYLSERIPRYTSYPTAPHFSAAVGPLSYRDWLKALPPRSQAVALSACAVLRDAVLVLRLPHQHHPPPRARRTLRGAAGARNRACGRPDRPATGSPISIGAAERRPSSGRRSSSPSWRMLRQRFDVEPDAEIAIEIDPRRLTGDGGGARGGWRHPRQPRRPDSILQCRKRSAGSRAWRRRKPASVCCAAPASRRSTSICSMACRAKRSRPAKRVLKRH